MKVALSHLLHRSSNGPDLPPRSRRRSPLRRSRRRTTITLGALLLAGSAAAVPSALAAAASGGDPVSPAAYAEQSSFGSPAVRAIDLGLDVPTSAMDDAHPSCAVEVNSGITTCFATNNDVSVYLAGNAPKAADPTMGAGGILPAGLGGTAAGLSGAYQLGRTCLNGGCTTHSVFYYTAGYFPCTHAYPNNDYYYNNTSTFSFYFVGADQFTLNCSRVVIYRNGTQAGAGAENCNNYANCSDIAFTFASLSWHNR